MKKFLALILSMVMVLSFFACGETTGNKPVTNTNSVTERSETTSNSEKEWKKFLNDYEDWVDDYVAILKKYQNNPTDMSILSDYADMMTELADWQSKTEKMQEELEKASPAEVAEYSAELLKIAAKITEAAY